jgi:hypothetical protein
MQQMANNDRRPRYAIDVRDRGWGWRWRGSVRVCVWLAGSVERRLAAPPARLAGPVELRRASSIAASFPVVRRRWRGLSGWLR